MKDQYMAPGELSLASYAKIDTQGAKSSLMKLARNKKKTDSSSKTEKIPKKHDYSSLYFGWGRLNCGY
jgi:uncharacterized protein YgiM (DUF1202 family)